VATQIFGVVATEPSVYLATSGLLLLVALIAVLVPVLRAVRVDPLLALRQDA
jgi:ABC-type antimicrobial peptide transport system permease subunit